MARSTYKFDIRAPWPQPSPVDPERMPPAVLHVPPAERREFLRTVVQRYIRTLGTEWPLALRYALTHEVLAPVPDTGSPGSSGTHRSAGSSIR